MRSDDIKLRAWTGTFKWPGKKPFRFGTIYIEEGTFASEQIRQKLLDKFTEAWGEILPDETTQPTLLTLEPGVIFFCPEGSQHD